MSYSDPAPEAERVSHATDMPGQNDALDRSGGGGPTQDEPIQDGSTPEGSTEGLHPLPDDVEQGDADVPSDTEGSEDRSTEQAQD